jgi:hypothetical protein
LGERRHEHETDGASLDGDGRACGLRDNAAAAGDADLPGRNVDSGDDAVSAATAAATASAASADGLRGRNVGPGGNALPATAASATAAAEARWRARLSGSVLVLTAWAFAVRAVRTY